MHMLYKNAAKQIKLLRIKHDLTQERLAEKLNVSPKYISSVETNAKKPSLEFYKNVANLFDVTFDYLFIDSIDVKRNIIMDSVVLRMSYMNEEEQNFILKMVEDFSEYINKKKGV